MGCTGCRWSVLLVLICTTLWGLGEAFYSPGWADQAEPDSVKQWAERLGKSLFDVGRKVTRESDIKKMYKQLGALVERRDGETLITEIRGEVENMVHQKMAAVQCLMERAEEVSMVIPDYGDDPDEDEMLFSYSSSKFSPIGTVGMFPPPTPEPPTNVTPPGIARYRKHVDPVWYRPIELSPDPHFHDIPVNESFSTVHVPTNVFDRAPDVRDAITWSEKLDNVFSANFRADPSLTWQYFGSARGFMRQYPASKWKSEGVDTYDCRTQPWYISAVTCSKDVVLLVDFSGSMTGFRTTIARLVAHSLLDTLTSNDFVSVIGFSDVITHPVPCFEDMLVQATKENINAYKLALGQTFNEGYGNFTGAFYKAFQLLESYRESRGCEGGCNQAIMLITDGVPGNLTEVFETYNRFNDTGEVTIPVRVFTYLLGKEVTNVREIQWMACLNRGYYVHMQSLEEVREEALRYLNVVARPLVLQGTTHPVVWTHAYADFQDRKVSVWLKDKLEMKMPRENRLAFTQSEEDRRFIKRIQSDENLPRKVQRYELMTSVSIPVFDRQGNRNNETRTAELLGVAGLDVPLRLFQELTMPYKVGVNGYAFLITNNGYILMHPELRPVVEGYPRDNFNSVDLTEIEIADDGSEEPREPNEDMLELRKAMVEHLEGSAPGIKIKFAYDNKRRLAIEKKDFFYTPVDGTPFSLGLVLPPNYGRYTIGLGEKFRKMERAGITSTNYFHGSNWRIHPEWVYCKHLHDTKRDFDNPEEQLMYFLREKDRSDNWKWRSDPPVVSDNHEDSEEDDSCGRPQVPEDAYFCNQDLMEHLILEAKALNSWYGSDVWDLRDKRERDPVQQFNVSMRFVATHSGLTRWQHVPDSGEHEEKFGDWNSRAVDEDWYKAAVLLHEESPDSFLFSVPFDGGPGLSVPVTGTSAIYHQDGGFEVPAAVVGFQMPLEGLQQHLLTISESLASPECQNSTLASCGCASEELMCFLVDTHGYVVVSEEANDTGRFFGDVAPDVMVMLRTLEVYREVPLYDYQALCLTEVKVHSGAAEALMTPLRWIQWMGGWMVSQLVQLSVSDLLQPIYALGDVFYDSYELGVTEDIDVEVPVGTTPRPAEGITFRVDTEPCDKLRNMAYLELLAQDEPRVYTGRPEEPDYFTSTLQPDSDEGPDSSEGTSESSESMEDIKAAALTNNTAESDSAELDNEVPTGSAETTEAPTEAPKIFYSRAFVAQRVPHTNLLLVVVDGLSPEEDPESLRWSAGSDDVSYGNVTHPCYKLPLNDLPRRRLAGCLSHHPLEAEIEQCGRGGHPGVARGLMIFMLVLAALARLTAH